MQLCLITALTHWTDGRQARVMDLQDAPLGPLTLAAILGAQGAAVSLLDLDQEFARRDRAAGPEQFIRDTAARLAASPAGVFGFSTLCSSYPLTLRLTKLLKELRPESLIVLGGPQASVVDTATLNAFRHVDCILRGEADHSLPALLDALQCGGRHLHFVPGLSWRLGSSVQRNPDPPPVEDLDGLPLPAYELCEGLEIASCISLELGRGCPFACSFCSTNDFFRRRFRLKSPEVVIRQMQELHARYQVRNFSLVHDMFTVDRRRVVEFCRAMIASASGFRWSCSARTDCVDDDLLALMAQAGCEGIFYGIETGSQSLQKTINKSLDVAQALQVVRHTSAHGIPSTASAITGFPGERAQDFRDTVDFLMNAAAGDDVQTQLHLLAPLAGTPIARQYARELALDRIQSDISIATLLTPEEWGWIERSPEIFTSFYHVPSPHLDRIRLVDFARFLSTGLRQARWLFLALHQMQGHIVDVFDAWHAGTARSSAREWDAFLDFVAERYPHPAIAAILYLQRALQRHPPQPESEPPPLPAVPALSPRTRVIPLPFSMAAWLQCLRTHRLQEFYDQSPCTVAITSARGRERILELHAFQASVLALCDGVRDCAGIARLIDWSAWSQFSAAPRPLVVSIALDALAQDGVISWGGSPAGQIPAQVAAAV